ncbi:MAG TPA: MutH/Sau3AI family endonuclease [Methanocorpusculum sp.]|nr:MutH/Sau3AI family endonuclease [Methanocorpusculum sp.]
MRGHVYDKSDLIYRLEQCLGKTFEKIDNKGLFDHVQEFRLQKGIAGSVVEQCIFGYSPDTKQKPDLTIMDGEKATKTELKTTGMLIDPKSVKHHYIAKEPMSITAVGVYDIAEQEFYTSHFWEKLEHMLIVYYHYDASHAVSPYEYKNFRLVGYEFHEFSDEDVEILKNDWENVRKLCEGVVAQFPGSRDAAWKDNVKQEYIKVHGQLRHVLSYIDLAPKFPPRFRLKKPIVSAMIANHFGYELEQLPGRYTAITDIDRKCNELTAKYKGRTIASLAQEFGIPYHRQHENKAITEQIIVAMFGGESARLNRISLFEKFGLIGKTVVVTSRGGRTEDMKLFRVDCDEITRTEVFEEDGSSRPYLFEDSDFYSYFADYEFLCIVFEEAKAKVVEEVPGMFMETPHKLGDNRFVGFRRLVFSDQFIDEKVKPVWEDIRTKVMTGTLVDVVRKRKDGKVIINKNGEVSSAPNFMKSRDNDVFLRGSGTNSSSMSKTECINGISMLPQYVWVKGTSIVREIDIKSKD